MLEELLEGGGHLQVVGHLGPGSGKQGGLDGVEKGGQIVFHPALAHHNLLSRVPSYRHILVLFHVPGSDLHAETD